MTKPRDEIVDTIVLASEVVWIRIILAIVCVEHGVDGLLGCDAEMCEGASDKKPCAVADEMLTLLLRDSLVSEFL